MITTPQLDTQEGLRRGLVAASIAFIGAAIIGNVRCCFLSITTLDDLDVASWI